MSRFARKLMVFYEGMVTTAPNREAVEYELLRVKPGVMITTGPNRKAVEYE